MDPSTTLVTFLLQTHPSVQSVHLIGSWDNFSQSYSMERDVRRGRGQWRGCYAFRDIICDDMNNNNTNSPSFNKRNGGLKMGHTYYYYYEVDGSVETHDPSMPSTTACPYLPGQIVNSLSVPVEQALRQRSASLSSMRDEDLKTMNPNAKFITPRPTPAAPVEGPVLRRLGSSPLLNNDSTSRPSSPPVWKRLFSRKLVSRDGERGRSRDRDDQSSASNLAFYGEERSTTPSDGTRTREISPESLRRFLSDDMPPGPDSNLSQRPAVAIPEEIVEEMEDDDNFASSAVSESQPFATCLSPPPFKRGLSSDTIPLALNNSSSLTLTPAWPASQPIREAEAPTSAILPSLPKLETLPQTLAALSPACSSVFTSPTSPRSLGEEMPTFYDSTDDDDDIVSGTTSDCLSFQPPATLSPLTQTFEGYSLPRHGDDVEKTIDSTCNYSTTNSPQLFARADTAFNIRSGNFLSDPIDTGLDDFFSELGWMVDVIGNKRV